MKAHPVSQLTAISDCRTSAIRGSRLPPSDSQNVSSEAAASVLSRYYSETCVWLQDVISQCWHEDPSQRPTARQLVQMLTVMDGDIKVCCWDCVMDEPRICSPVHIVSAVAPGQH